MSGSARLPLSYWGLVLTYLAVAVNLSVTSVALPSIASDLDATTAQLSWIFNVTPLVSAGLMLFAGAWGDRFGRRRLLVIGLLVFLASSLLSATATDANLLIAYRALTGAGSALAMPAALALTFDVVPEQSRRTAVGILATTQAAGSLIGPVLAGTAMAAWSWPAVFLSVVPFIGLALLGAWRLPKDSTHTSHPMDSRGASLAAIASVLLVYAATALSIRQVAPAVLALGVVAVAVLLLVRHERRTPHPLFNPAVLRQRPFRLATTIVLGSQIVLGGLIFVITQYLQLVLGYSPFTAGMMLIPCLASWVLASSTSGRTSQLLGVRRVVSLGLGLGALGLLLLALQGTASRPAMLIFGLFLTGLMAVGPALMTTVALTCYSAAERTVGAATNGAAARFGFSFGIAIMGGALGAIYASLVSGATSGLEPAEVTEVEGGLAGALKVAASLPDGTALADSARAAFTTAYSASLIIGAIVASAMALLVAVVRVSEGVEDARDGGP